MAELEGVSTVCIDMRYLLLVLGPVVHSLSALIVVLVALVVLEAHALNSVSILVV